ncbi:unnamed protein product, partial [Heterotrigona itama]
SRTGAGENSDRFRLSVTKLDPFRSLSRIRTALLRKIYECQACGWCESVNERNEWSSAEDEPDLCET